MVSHPLQDPKIKSRPDSLFIREGLKETNWYFFYIMWPEMNGVQNITLRIANIVISISFNNRVPQPHQSPTAFPHKESVDHYLPLPTKRQNSPCCCHRTPGRGSFCTKTLLTSVPNKQSFGQNHAYVKTNNMKAIGLPLIQALVSSQMCPKSWEMYTSSHTLT